MNGKYALALFLALQVTVSLCEIAEPEAELVQKFEDMKNTFYNRVMNAYNKAHGIATPYVEQVKEVATPYVEQVKEVATPYVEQVQAVATPYVEQVKEVVTPYVEQVKEVVTPYVEQVKEVATPHQVAATAFFDELKNREQTQAFVKIFTDLATNVGPMVDKAQNSGLGLYGQYLRPQVGESLDGAINNIKEYLDLYFPA